MVPCSCAINILTASNETFLIVAQHPTEEDIEDSALPTVRLVPCDWGRSVIVRFYCMPSFFISFFVNSPLNSPPVSDKIRSINPYNALVSSVVFRIATPRVVIACRFVLLTPQVIRTVDGYRVADLFK